MSAIALKAGVSHATVSLVLNDRAEELQINRDTAQRVRRIAAEMNYVPNPLALGLRGKQTKAIGVLWSLVGPHPSEGTARRITLLAQQRGFSASLADSLHDPKIILSALADFQRRRVDGVIALLALPALPQDRAIRRMLEQFKAVVLVLRDDVDPGLDHVFHDSDVAFGQMVEHLRRTGRRRLAYLHSMPACASKRAIIVQHMARCGYDPDQLMDLDFGAVVDPRQTPALLAAAKADYDALICVNDEVAAAAMKWLRSQGRAVPRDVAVVGFNDSPLSEYLDPPLASVRRHDQAVADAAAQLLFDRLQDPDRPPQSRTVAMDFVARDSAG